jgi:hypothetical protein
VKINLFLFLIPAAFLFSACHGRPSSVLSEKKMEDVLYDLYITEVEIDDHYAIFHGDSLQRQTLLNSVFEKHKITEEAFDTSLVWYNKNIDNYLKINKKVGERLSVLSDTLTARIDRKKTAEWLASIHNLFPDTTSFFLQSGGLLQNVHPYRINTSEIQTLRSFRLDMDILGVSDSIFPVLSFCMQASDTVFVDRDTIRTNGHYSRSFSIPSRYTLKEIYGSFYMEDTKKALILFHDVTLLKQENLLNEHISR